MADTKLLLGKRIRYLRRLDDLSQEDLAEKAGVSHKYIGEIERGKANLTIDIAEKIAAALNIEMMDLFDYKHEVSQQELKKEINALIRNAGDDELQKIYRVIKSILKSMRKSPKLLKLHEQKREKKMLEILVKSFYILISVVLWIMQLSLQKNGVLLLRNASIILRRTFIGEHLTNKGTR